MGIREALLLLVFAATCLTSLVVPRIALYGYVSFALMRPDLLAFADGRYPFSLILAGCTFLAAIRCLATGVGGLLWSTAGRTLLLLQIPLALSVMLAINPNLSIDRYNYYMKMIAVVLCIPIIVKTEEHLRELIAVIALSLGVMAIKFAAFGVLHGGVALEGGFGDVLDDNNFLALALGMMVPLAWYSMQLTTSRLLRVAFMIVAGSCMLQVVMSHSRGGSVAMAIGIGMILMKTRRKVMPFVAVAVCISAAIYMVRDTYLDRMETLRDPNQEASAASRIVHAKAALAMAADHPLTGVGFGGMNYAALAPRYQQGLDSTHVAHNTYLQMLVDSGVFAFGIYIWSLLATIVQMRKSAKRWQHIAPARAYIPLALQTSLVIFVIGATFYSCQRMDVPYFVLMCAACWENIDRHTDYVPEEDDDEAEQEAAAHSV